MSTDLLFEAKVKDFLRTNMDLAAANQLWQLGQGIIDDVERALFYHDVVADIQAKKEGRAPNALKERDLYKWEPVGLREFIESPHYLNKEGDVYPLLMNELEEINSGKYIEVVFTGGIGSGKTTGALYTTAYQLYLLSCMKNPHQLFGLDSSSEILFVFQSLNAALAKGVDYNRFRDMIEGSKYFKTKFMFDRNLDSKLVFPNRIEVHPVSGKETAAIGQNVIGGIIDELNYMAVTSKSKQSVDAGTYDQAVALYNSIARRRKSRFMSGGKMPGILCLVSSKKYPGQFTDQKEDEQRKEIAEHGASTIYIYDKRVWEVKPDSFDKGFFHVFVGDLARKPRILKDGEEVSDQDRKLILSVPTDFKTEFEKDIINALREIGGVSTLARHPYFVEVQHLDKAFGRHHSIFAQEKVDFVETKLAIRKGEFFKPELPRFVHIDLAISGDSAGVAIGTVVGFQHDEVGLYDGGQMPVIRIDGILEVKPPRGAEIQFWKIREVLFALRDMGLNIRWVTFDSFQSKDSQQILRQRGFVVGEQSIDVTMKPYDFTKSAVYSGRVRMPMHQLCRLEMVALERDAKTGKVDHPPNLSKDCSDAVAGVVYGLTQRREIWSMYNIPLLQIPSSVTSTEDKLQKNDDRLKGERHTQDAGLAV